MNNGDVLDLFNCMVATDRQRMTHKRFGTGYAHLGVVLDFHPNPEQIKILEEVCKPLDITTLFTREERETAPVEHLLVKQLIHYFEVYGLDMPGLFDLECPGGQIVSMRLVKGISGETLASKVRKLLYTNAPVKDADQLRRIILDYAVAFDIDKIENNEMRMAMYRAGLDTFTRGDDAVRYICWMATGQALLIKSPEVIKAITAADFRGPFFSKHEMVLAQVFNRHKRLILAAKNSRSANAINRIARLSKTRHVPIRESMAKTFIHHALTRPTFAGVNALSHISLRDKFKYLNLLAQKKLQSKTATFKVRNGKVWTSIDRPVYELADISRVESIVLTHLASRFEFLKGKNILLDKSVDYGLPISRKQTVGNLPFGTHVTSFGNEISSGMYWENAWGATDLDLSTIDAEGYRVGWGQCSGYRDKEIIFSGDLTSAPKGAMEFMTSRTKNYGLFVNIYSGGDSADMELVIGANRTKKQWIDEPLIREKLTLKSRGTVIGFVKGKTFVVYSGRLSNKRVSGVNPIINEMAVDPWTIQKLFSALNVNFDVDRQDEIEYDHDLSYEAFSFDKLEELFKSA